MIALYVLGVILAGLIGYLAYVGSKTTKEQAQKISALQTEVEELKKALGKAVTKEAFEGQITSLREGIAPLVVEETVERFAQLERQATTALFIRGRAIEARLFSARNGSGHKKPEPTAQLDASQISAEMLQARQKREKCKVGSKDHETQDYIVQRLKVDLALANSQGKLTAEVLEAEIVLVRWEREHSQKGSGKWAGHNSRLQDLKAQLANFSNSAAASAANN